MASQTGFEGHPLPGPTLLVTSFHSGCSRNLPPLSTPVLLRVHQAFSPPRPPSLYWLDPSGCELVLLPSAQAQSLTLSPASPRLEQHQHRSLGKSQPPSHLKKLMWLLRTHYRCSVEMNQKIQRFIEDGTEKVLEGSTPKC